MPSPPTKIPTKSTIRFKTCAHFGNLNVRHFEMVEAMGLSSMESRFNVTISIQNFIQTTIGSKVATTSEI
jgi:hypothetical protein